MARKEKPQNGLRVEVKNNNIDFALRKFKKMVKNSDLMLDLKKKSYYEKPSRKRREKKNLQKFSHYAFLTVLYSFGASVAGMIVYSMIVAFRQF